MNQKIAEEVVLLEQTFVGMKIKIKDLLKQYSGELKQTFQLVLNVILGQGIQVEKKLCSWCSYCK